MFSIASRRVALAAPFKRAAVLAARPISSSAMRMADHPSVPIIQGEGTPAGQVPTDEAQATGLERCVFPSS
jgi:cytochrome c oxidase subunit 5b